MIFLAIGAFSFARESSTTASDISQVYQYYLLANTNGKTAPASNDGGNQGSDPQDGDNDSSKSSDSKSSGAPKWFLGILGNGGNQGSFTYNDIEQGAPKDNTSNARQFCAMMATLSGYNYISVQSNKLTLILDIIARFVVGFLLLVVGIMMDIFDMFNSLVVEVIAHYNIFTLLGQAMAASPAGDKMGAALGLSVDEIRQFISFAFMIFTCVILFTVVMVFRREQVDETALAKLKGRLIGLIGIPIVMSMVCVMLSEVASDLHINPTTAPTYADWIIDVKDWAEQYNFNTSNAGVGGITAPQGNGYVDTSYNPYKQSKGGSHASTIGQALYKIGLGKTSTKIPNATMAFAYMTSQTFTGRDYLGYIGQTRVPNIVQGFQGTKDNDIPHGTLYDFDHAYTSTGAERDDKKAGWEAPDAMKQAKDDYTFEDENNKTQAKSSPVQTWEDRYIYGAKNTGSLSKFYKEQPSMEQIQSGAGVGVGDGSSDALTYESTYLALCTQFTENGGYFSIDGPTYGAYATISKFDSNRYNYYDYSMVGNPVFTIPAMLTTGLLQILVGMTVVLTLWSIGIIDMNLTPARSWVKAVTMGDLEYTYATLIYGFGIVATVISITVVPGLLTSLFNAISSVIGGMITDSSSNASTVASTEMMGSSYWFSFIFAIFGLLSFFKDWGGFREKLVALMAMPWQWCKEKGRAMEDRVNGGGPQAFAKASKALKDRQNAKNRRLMALNSNSTREAAALNKATGGLAGDLAQKALVSRAKNGALVGDYDPNKPGTIGEQTLDQIRSLGASRRIGQALDGVDNALGDPDDQPDIDKALSDDSITNPDGTLNADNALLTPESTKAMNGFNRNVDQLADDTKAQNAEASAAAVGLTAPEYKQLRSLEAKGANVPGMSSAKMKDFKNLNGKALKGKPLSKDEQERLSKYNSLLKKGLGAEAFATMAALQKKSAHNTQLQPTERRQLRRLQNLQLRENSRSPLSAGQATRYAELTQKRNDIIKQKMDVKTLAKIHRLENLKRQLTPQESVELKELKSQANKIADQGMKAADLKQFKHLDRSIKPLMTNGQRTQLQRLQNKAIKSLSATEQAKFKQRAKAISNQVTKVNSNVRTGHVDLKTGSLAKAKSDIMVNARNQAKATARYQNQIRQGVRDLQRASRRLAQTGRVDNFDKLQKTKQQILEVSKKTNKKTNNAVRRAVEQIDSELKRYNYTGGVTK